tara:strand:- start:1902 stop:2183 length:282 start_codon:yes stop_codon:yes gene_type:complete
VSFADDLTSMLDGPFGVSCTAGSTTANGILNEPTAMAVGDQILYSDYVLICEASKFGSLVAGDSLTVDGTAMEVKAVELGLDGLEAQIALSKT